MNATWRWPDALAFDIEMDETPIRSITRALHVLRLMNTAQRWTLHELHIQLGLPKTTTFRILSTLQHEGYVQADVARGQYTLTRKVQELGGGYTEQSEVVAAGAPIALRVTREIKWPLAIGVRDGDSMVVGYSTMPYSPLAVHATTIGHRLSLISTAMGQSYLAHCSERERQIVLEHFSEAIQAKSEQTVLDIKATLMRVAAQGYAVRRPTLSSDSATLAVPIRQDGLAIAAIGMTTFGRTMTDRLVQEFLPILRQTATEIAEAYRHEMAVSDF